MNEFYWFTLIQTVLITLINTYKMFYLPDSCLNFPLHFVLQFQWTCVHDIQTLINEETEYGSKESFLETDNLSLTRRDLKRRIRLLHGHLSYSSVSHSVSDSNGHDDNQENSNQSSGSHTLTSELSPAVLESRSNGDRHAEYEWPPSHASPFHFRRLLFHSGEPNVGQGYIKEQSFSPDGRIIASPFANCVRLLAFDSECHELCDAVPEKPRPLRQVALVAGNKSSVLTSTFSPVQLLYAAGAEDGSISFCSPKL